MQRMNSKDEDGTGESLKGAVAVEKPSLEEPSLSEVDKTLADSFPASDPPAQP